MTRPLSSAALLGEQQEAIQNAAHVFYQNFGVLSTWYIQRKGRPCNWRSGQRFTTQA